MTRQTPNITGDTVSTITKKTLRRFPAFNLIELQNVFFLCVNTGVHVTLDSLMKDIDLKSTIKNLVSSSGRSVPASGEDDNNKK